MERASVNEDQTVLGSDLYAEMMHLWRGSYELSYFDSAGRKFGYIISFVNKRDENESQIDTDDDWRQLANWAFAQAVHLKMMNAYQSGTRVFSVWEGSVTFSDFDEQMKKNLADESWAEVRHGYRSD